ncbi:MAG: TonB-dependent receptor [Sterolibacterium sp.]|nr:TonB-dependent receptor [Sterolibacterium sp.]
MHPEQTPCPSHVPAVASFTRRHSSWLTLTMALPLLAVAAPGQLRAEDARLEEIIVTAQKRREPLQKTPLAITALSSRTLEEQGIDNTMALANQLPSLVMVPFTGNRAAPNMAIRGMGNLDAQTTKDAANGVYIDGVPVSRSVGLAADIADLERVELLRGPQGTLYGRNTTGGAINFITVRPEKDRSFEQTLTLGNLGLVRSKTRLNLPLSDTLYTRVAYLRSSDQGWVDNTNTTLPDQTRFNQDRKEAARWAWRLLAGETLTADLDLDYSTSSYGNVFFQRVAGAAAVNGRQESANPVKGLSPSQMSTAGQSLTLNARLAGLTLRSITAWRRMDNQARQNYADLFTQNDDQNQNQFSQEFQLLGTTLEQRLDYVIGLFHFKEQGTEQVRSVFSPTNLDAWRVVADSTSNAFYGQATWIPPILSDRLHLTVGLRETRDERGATKTFITSNFAPASNGLVVPARKQFHKLTPTYTLDYAVTDDLNVYARLAYGYRAGGFNTRSPYAGFGNGFHQENVRSTELGMKSDLFNHRTRLNVALFHNHYTDLQVDQVRNPSFFTDTLNAGRARIRGAEIELTALLSHGFSTRLFHTWLDARYGSYVDNGIDLAAAKHVPLAPRGQGGLGLRYEGGRTDSGRLRASLDYLWQSRYYTNPNPETLTQGYGLWNARIEWADLRLPQGRLRVALWGKNLGDKTYRLANTNLGGMTAQLGPPRTLGIDAIFSF